MSSKEFVLNRYDSRTYCKLWNMADKTQKVILVGEIELEGYQEKFDLMITRFWSQITEIDNNIQCFCREAFEKGTYDIDNYIVSLQWVSVGENKVTMGYWGDHVNIELRAVCVYKNMQWEISDIYYQ
ncbi:MAG: hypothetical protein J6K58_10445 [Lachnospiraceae bacterium]|nr:hypothetical protein [Lachnospiraceae bacterium]